ncbi:trehalose-phosphate phosphatase A-like [Humulus lupulus]|uniref:trehalose-phosphate phosphatase A-like n=1 Tax=Humulus lupulus TaxID=3486 RepID=UPI002B40BEF7|nr:trehalose-phosphate phosphatase A-like [Humulus lupulus]
MGYQQTPESMCKSKFDEAGETIIGSYASWLAKHPSALENFDEMMNKAKGKDIVVFLDYDGTLSQIVKEPDQAFMSEAMRSAVREVSLYFPTAIVSGRRRDKVFEFVQLENVYYAGSHGMDISTPSGSKKYSDHKFQTRTTDEKGNEVVHFRPAQEFLPKIQEILKALKDKTKGIKGAIVEDNKFCISVHFRQVVDEEDVYILKEMVENLIEAYPNFRIASGKKVMEIRPRIDWDKGRALQYLLGTLDLGTSNNVLPMYLGDDKTDEDAFRVVRRGQGFPIVVSSTPKQTKAAYSLREPSEVMAFLIRLVKWKKSVS